VPPEIVDRPPAGVLRFCAGRDQDSSLHAVASLSSAQRSRVRGPRATNSRRARRGRVDLFGSIRTQDRRRLPTPAEPTPDKWTLHDEVDAARPRCPRLNGRSPTTRARATGPPWCLVGLHRSRVKGYALKRGRPITPCAERT
jgi:hypothetical protein